MVCPMFTRDKDYKAVCCKQECAWWCDDDGVCAVKKIGLELISIDDTLWNV